MNFDYSSLQPHVAKALRRLEESRINEEIREIVGKSLARSVASVFSSPPDLWADGHTATNPQPEPEPLTLGKFIAAVESISPPLYYTTSPVVAPTHYMVIPHLVGVNPDYVVINPDDVVAFIEMSRHHRYMVIRPVESWKPGSQYAELFSPSNRKKAERMLYGTEKNSR